MIYKGDNVVGALMNVPIFVGTFPVMTDFAVLEDMDAYRDEGIGPRERNIDEVGGMHIFWNSMCVLFVLGFRRFSSTQSCS
ncbi:hypothetical protein Tco_0773194 [Tanacetum coccineum]|uniref:Uncharacterized protein n=1 Tax=Tanacetum coccineum TaxID=301880 RepID=A0ABQ4ZNV6_9ASTR